MSGHLADNNCSNNSCIFVFLTIFDHRKILVVLGLTFFDSKLDMSPNGAIDCVKLVTSSIGNWRLCWPLEAIAIERRKNSLV